MPTRGSSQRATSLPSSISESRTFLASSKTGDILLSRTGMDTFMPSGEINNRAKKRIMITKHGLSVSYNHVVIKWITSFHCKKHGFLRRYRCKKPRKESMCRNPRWTEMGTTERNDRNGDRSIFLKEMGTDLFFSRPDAGRREQGIFVDVRARGSLRGEDRPPFVPADGPRGGLRRGGRFRSVHSVSSCATTWSSTCRVPGTRPAGFRCAVPGRFG